MDFFPNRLGTCQLLVAWGKLPAGPDYLFDGEPCCNHRLQGYLGILFGNTAGNHQALYRPKLLLKDSAVPRWCRPMDCTRQQNNDQIE
jgi:hypothetical protein